MVLPALHTYDKSELIAHNIALFVEKQVGLKAYFFANSVFRI